MNLSETCIKRPVLTIVISLVLILIGLMSLRQLSLRSDPKIFRPRLAIRVMLPGASAEYMERNITTRLEAALRSVSDVSMMQSTASQNDADIILHFKNISEQDFVTIQSQVNQAVSMARMPDTATVRVFAGGRSDSQIMNIGVKADGMTKVQLSDFVHNKLVNDLQEVSGVGQVDAWTPNNALRVNLNYKKMAELKLGPEDIITALQANDISVQAGEISNAEQALPLNIVSKPASIEAFRDMIVKKAQGRVIRLKDIAKVEIASASFSDSFTYFNGKPGAMLSVSVSDEANPIKTAQLLRKKIKQLSASLPPGVSLHVVFDKGIILQHSVEELYLTIIEAVAFVALVTLLFLGRFQFTLVPIVTIPVCIIASFGFVWLLGYSINLMTLLALVLAVGLVVDDAIVVLENCYRHIEEGLAPMKAAVRSMKEVTFPVIGMTISIIAVYLPTAFMRGKTAVYFQQFSFTLAGAVFISGVVALTLTPMMCARLHLRTTAEAAKQSFSYAGWIDRFFDRFRNIYSTALQSILRLKWLVIAIFILCFASGVFYYQKLPRSLEPKEYAGYVFMGMRMPSTASSAYLIKHLQPAQKKALGYPEIKYMMSFGSGSNDDSSMVYFIIQLQPKFSSSKATQQVAARIQSQFSKWISPQVFLSPININNSGGSDSSNMAAVSFYLQGYVPYSKLSNAADRMVTALRKTGMFSQVENGLQYSKQQYDISINRGLANQLQVPIASINSALQYYLSGYSITNGFDFGGVSYPVIVQLPRHDLGDLRVLGSLFVNSSSGERISLSRLVRVKALTGLPERYHLNGARAAELSVVVKDEYSTGTVVNEINQIGRQVLPSGVTVGFSEHFLDTLHGNDTMLIVFGLGIVFIYLILSALFESFVDPFIILLTVPLCVVGAIVALHLLGGEMNIYTSIGFVTLIGLVSKHGVLITHFANELRHSGEEKISAIIKSASMRLRPILMTTATMVMGALPLVLSSGVGSVARLQVGVVIVAGLIVGTFFSLFVVPVAYSLLKRS